MRKILKPRPSQPTLQPWQHEQQVSASINHTYIPLADGINPQTPIKQFQENARFDRPTGFCYQRLTKSSQGGNTRKDYQKNKQMYKNQKIDFVKKNQQNLRSHYCMSSNYSSLLNDNLDDEFVPLNPNSGYLSYIKRPIINTTYIGYYDQKPFFIQSPAKTIIRKERIRTKSTQYNNRPTSSDPTISYDSQIRKIQDQQQFTHFNERATLSVGGCHLQKMLKIKQKLRQKLKRNSQKKDIQRGLYVKSAMKIQQQDHNFLGLQNQSYIHTRMPTQSRKSSSKSIENNKQKIRVDKWKEYMRIKSNIENQNKQKAQNQKNKQMFGVIGGAIYR